MIARNLCCLYQYKPPPGWTIDPFTLNNTSSERRFIVSFCLLCVYPTEVVLTMKCDKTGFTVQPTQSYR